jgi:hypothetical protein
LNSQSTRITGTVREMLTSMKRAVLAWSACRYSRVMPLSTSRLRILDALHAALGRDVEVDDDVGRHMKLLMWRKRFT